MKTPHKLRKRDLCQCDRPRPIIVGFDARWLVEHYCKRCMKEILK